MKKIFECVFDFLSEVWDFVLPMLFWVPVYCIPSVIQLFGFKRIAFIGFIVLMVLTGALFVLALVQFILAKRNEDVNQMNRCLFTWLIFGGSALVGTLVAKLVGVL